MRKYDWDDFFDDDDDEPTVEDMMELRDLIRKEIANLPKERTIFHERQVLSFEDLEVGKWYRDCHRTLEDGTDFILLDGPTLTEFGWKVTVQYYIGCYEWSSNALSIPQTMSLEDAGIIPYEGGGWNTANFVIALDKGPIDEK